MKYLEGLDADEFDIELSKELDKFNVKETWNMDKRMLIILYQKYKQYLEEADKHIDMEYHTYTNFNLADVTKKELIENILEDIKLIYHYDEDDDSPHKHIATMRLFHNIGVSLNSLWW